MVKIAKKKPSKTKHPPKITKSRQSVPVNIQRRGHGEVIRLISINKLIQAQKSSAFDCDISNKDIPISFRAINSNLVDKIAAEVTLFSKELVKQSIDNKLTSIGQNIEYTENTESTTTTSSTSSSLFKPPPSKKKTKLVRIEDSSVLDSIKSSNRKYLKEQPNIKVWPLIGTLPNFN
jgi:hypothetical protein